MRRFQGLRLGPSPLTFSFGIMSARARKIIVWSVLVFVVGLVVCALLPTGPIIRDTPFIREYARIHAICSKLRFYAEMHPGAGVDDLSSKSVDDLAAAGILSLDDAAYIREHSIAFRGFDPTRIGGAVPVLESYSPIPGRRVVSSDTATAALSPTI
jgi:hypothetical protein